MGTQMAATPLRYHAAVYAQLGLAPMLNSHAVRDKNYPRLPDGRSLPESIREWYSLDRALPILREFSNDDQPRSPEEFEIVEPKALSDYYSIPDGDGPFHLYDLLPPIRPFGKSVVFMYENQGVCRWSVELGQGDDPPVIVEVDTYDSGGECASLCSEKFSTFMECHVWDHWQPAAPHLPHKRTEPLLLQAQDIALSQKDLAYLQGSFRERMRTFGWPGLVALRFENDFGRLLLWNNPGQTDWFVSAATPDGLRELTRSIWTCGELSTRLWTANDRGTEAEVLADLKRKT